MPISTQNRLAMKRTPTDPYLGKWETKFPLSSSENLKLLPVKENHK